ncbi:hypothetical protein As57867_005692, partial [Aphanomyces stellatus]
MGARLTSGECYLVQGTTCCYGIVMKNERCFPTTTYASLHLEAYDAYVGVCATMGLVLFLACIRKLYCIQRVGGSAIQKQVYSLLIVAS